MRHVSQLTEPLALCEYGAVWPVTSSGLARTVLLYDSEWEANGSATANHCGVRVGMAQEMQATLELMAKEMNQAMKPTGQSR